jgi:hypothetical protein
MLQPKNTNGIHEGVIKDIVDLIGDGGLDSISDKNFLNGKNSRYFSSITKATSNLVLTFPVIVDESVPLSTAALVAKAVERKMVALLQMLFSAINISNNKDAFDFIGKVHKNLTSDDIVSFINRMDSRPYKESVDGTAELDIEAINKALTESMKHNGVYLNPELEPALENKYIYKSRAKAQDIIDHRRAIRVPNSMLTGLFSRTKKVRNDFKNNTGKENNSADDKTTAQYTNNFKIKEQVFDQDVKKANEAVPSLLIIHFRSGEDEKSAGDAVIGVKAKLVYVSQEDMADRIIMKNGDNNIIFSLLRATTGELSMIKDFMFAVDRAKLDTFANKNSSTPLWKMLERRAIVNKKNRFFDSANGSGTAIATLLISSDTESLLEKEYNFKCRPYNMLNVMSEYSCLGFIIADDVTEKVKMLFDDNSTNFEVLSYTSMEREDKSQYKKLINLMVNR